MAQLKSHLPAGKGHDNFTTWAGQNGITIKKVKVAAIPNAGIGIVATENIKVHIKRSKAFHWLHFMIGLFPAVAGIPFGILASSYWSFLFIYPNWHWFPLILRLWTS